jgi:2Fe-2S ferredoxin
VDGDVPKVVFISPDGTEHAVDASFGDSLMVAATQNGVPGIVAEYGGNCSCPTCHVWVREEFLPLVGEPGDMEEDLVDLAVTERAAVADCRARLS